ncbi:hypothetical protein Tco_1432195, partial [Tanacetum coccineum]
VLDKDVRALGDAGAFNGGQEAAAQKALELLIGLAGIELRFLRRQLVELVGVCCRLRKRRVWRRGLGI